MPPRTLPFLSAVTAGLLVGAILHTFGCSGPQPLSVAIRPTDEAAYVRHLGEQGQSPCEAYLAWKSQETGQTIEQVRAADAAIEDSGNPFSARRDPSAVSKGAVIYKLHCASCHGENVDGRGPGLPVALDSLDFHSFSKRFAVTLHGGAPRAWYRKIQEGVTSETKGPDGKPLAMPPFKDVLAKEQTWLAITYLQSLDMNASTAKESPVKEGK